MRRNPGAAPAGLENAPNLLDNAEDSSRTPERTP